MSADEGSRRSVGIAATGAVLVGGVVYIADSGPLWPGLALLSVLAAALAGGLLARRPRDVLALGSGAFAGVWLASVARALEPGSPGDAALLGLVPAAFFGALVLAAGYAVFALLLPVRGRARRLAAAAVLGAGLVLAWVALLSGTSAAPVQSYRFVDPQTIVVVVGGAPHGWTRVSGVAESASTVAVSAQTTTWLPRREASRTRHARLECVHTAPGEMPVPRPRAAMRKIREALRLCLAEGLSPTLAGIATGLSRSTVRRYVLRAAEVGVGWPLPPDLDDRALEERLYGRAAPPPAEQRPMPDWPLVHRELRRKSVTLALLWSEYRTACPDGFGYTWFTQHYRAWAGRLDLVLRGDHRAGEKLFLDFAGQTIPITDPLTGEIWQAQLFVAVLGASNYTYAETLPGQAELWWAAANVRAFEFFGGAPAILVPDNLKAGVSKAHRYEPILNASYAELAAHYGCAIIPARPYKPRDKAKVESGVLVAERWVAAALRNRTFFSLAEANAAIRERVAWLNDRPFKKLEGSRASLFAELDRPALRPLPATPYEYAVWKQVKVSIDYHVECERHYYSVPYQLVGEQVDVRASARTIEIFARGRRVASHLRSSAVGRHTTESAHMPESHRRHLESSPSRLVAWGEQTGPATGALVAAILASRPHPEQGFRSCLGIFRLGRRHGTGRLEAACTRALAVGALSYRSVDSILKAGLDRAPLPEPTPVRVTRVHPNVRGPGYYE